MKFEPYFMIITVTTTIQHKCCYKQWWKSQRETASPFCKGEVTLLPQSPRLSQLNRFQTERSFPGQWLRVPPLKIQFSSQCPNRILRFLFYLLPHLKLVGIKVEKKQKNARQFAKVTLVQFSFALTHSHCT